MADIEVDDIIRVVCRMELDGTDDVQNVYHCKNLGPVAMSAAVFLAAIETFMAGAYGGLEFEQTDEFTYEDITCYNVTQSTILGQTAFGVRSQGSSTQHRLPNQVAGLITFGVASSGSPGKKYIGGFTEDSNDDGGIVAAGPITALGQLATALLAGISIAGSDFEFGNYNVPLLRWAAWVSAVIDVVWSTQRRRKQGVGS